MSSAAVTVERAADFLGRRYDGHAEDIAELRGGEWSRAFSFRLDGRDLVARFGAWREDFEKDEAAMAFGGPDLPVPRVIEIGDAFGGAFAISERHFGLFLEELDTEQFQRVLPAVMRALDAMRALSAPSDRSQPWADWLLGLLVDRPGGRVSGWQQKLAASPELDALFVAGQEAIEDLLPACPDLQHVLHLDLINRNVLVTEDATRFEAVFDWGCLSYGDFVYEVAWLTFWAPWHAGLAATDIRGAVRDHYASTDLVVENLDERLRCYELHIGVSHLAYGASPHGREEDLLAVAARLRELI